MKNTFGNTVIFSLLFLLIFGILPAYAQETEDGVKKGIIQSFSDKYIVSPGDTINIYMLGEPDLTQKELPVKSDGCINISPEGEVKVAGFTLDEINTILTDKLSKYFVEPVISVEISSIRAPKIYVFGAVQKPGPYQYKAAAGEIAAPPTLVNAIGEAGGVNYKADLENVRVRNKYSGREQNYNLLELINNGDSSQDIYLNAGDTIFVPELKTEAPLSDEDFLRIAGSSVAPKDFPVRVTGAVKHPGVYRLTADSASLNTALAASEWFTIDAKTDAVKIHRITPQGNTSIIVVNPQKDDIILRPNDIVDVYDMRTSFAGRTYGFLNGLFGSTGGFGSAYNEVRFMFNPATKHDVYLK